MKSIRKIPLLLLAILVCIPSGRAQADIAPPALTELSGLQPFQFQSTEVQMVSERVDIEVLPNQHETAPDTMIDKVLVTAAFIMHNTGGVEERMQAIFPIDNLNACQYYRNSPQAYTPYEIEKASFKVSLDGVASVVTIVTTDGPFSDLYGSSCDEKIEWAGFEVAFPVDRDVKVEVQYEMYGSWGDTIHALEYILVTGAAWKGRINSAEIVLHLPYEATPENIRPDTSAGYQFLGNEIAWTFKDIEPSMEDNITISFIASSAWNEILDLRSRVQVDPYDKAAWLKLTDSYKHIAYLILEDVHYTVYKSRRDETYSDMLFETYRRALEANPDSAELNSSFAEFIYYDCCSFSHPSEAIVNQILPYIDRALALDPHNWTALKLLDELKRVIPSFTYSPATRLKPSSIKITSTPASSTPPGSPGVGGDKVRNSSTWLALVGFLLLLGAVFLTWWTVKSKRE